MHAPNSLLVLATAALMGIATAMPANAIVDDDNSSNSSSEAGTTAAAAAAATTTTTATIPAAAAAGGGGGGAAQITDPPDSADAAAARLEARASAAAVTAPWVEVDDLKQPVATHTPSITTKEDGSTEVVDAAPHDLTASVFTSTYYGIVTTSTGEPPIPSATGKDGDGAFARCVNLDGDGAPLCDPEPSSTMFQGTTYYVTWDPDYFNETTVSANATVEVSLRLEYLNRTAEKEAPDYSDTDDWETEGWAKLDQTKPVPAEWGYYPLYISSKYFKGPKPHNITVQLVVGSNGSEVLDKTGSAIPLVLDKHSPPDDGPTEIKHRDLVIALPVVFGSIFFMVVGVCIWNRKTRRIDLGNIMGRSRKGYTGRKTRRLFSRRDKGFGGASSLAGGPGSIRLEDRGATAEESRAFTDPLYGYADYTDPTAPPRRDSNDLGSLAGSPVTPGFRVDEPGNAFRDELRRQEAERRGGL